ncbi:MAG: ABC transporter permease [Marinobacter sp.]|nr:ABC transporter permease [Marinobacter sp.]
MAILMTTRMTAHLALTLTKSSLWHRRRILLLVTLTLTLSVSLLLGIQYVRSEIRQSFTNTISNTDLIIGARSGQLNLLLYSVFHIGDATNNLSWQSYQDLKDDERLSWLIPISLGDSYNGHRVVATTGAMFEHFRYGRSQPLAVQRGQWFNDLFEVVLGADVARTFNHNVGDQLIMGHGGGSVSFARHDSTPFTVAGVLDATGTPVDQAVYISLDSMEAMHVGWESGVGIPGRTLTLEQAKQRNLTPSNITAAFAGVERKVLTFRIQRDINTYSKEPLTAILPGVALSELWRLLGQFEKALLGITGFVVVVCLISLATVLLTLQAQRSAEIAILRATGASAGLIASLYLLESLAIALLACVLALALGAAGIAAVSPWLQANYGVLLTLRPLNQVEWVLLAAVPVSALVIGLVPALSAWRRGRRPGWQVLDDA